MSVAGPIIGWLVIFALFAEMCVWMVNRWGPM